MSKKYDTSDFPEERNTGFALYAVFLMITLAASPVNNGLAAFFIKNSNVKSQNKQNNLNQLYGKSASNHTNPIGIIKAIVQKIFF